MADHPRNTGPMRAARRCGAKTRKGTPCEAPAIAGKARCRMHGGKGSGAPEGNRNAVKYGLHTQEQRELRLHLRTLIRESRKLIEEI